MAAEPAFLSTPEAARRLRVTAKTVRAWIERDAFPGAIRLGRNYRVPESEVERVKREGLDLRELERVAA
jgi:excisionase family DNA binding protein